MNALIDVLEQLNADERNDFTSWLHSLSVKERDRVASVVKLTTIERIRTVLSVPKEQRISLFLVPYSPREEFGKELKPVQARIKKLADNLREKAKNDSWF